MPADSIPLRVSSIKKQMSSQGILFDDRWVGPHGIGRFAAEMKGRLPMLVPVPHTLRRLHPLEPLWLSYVVARSPARAYFTPGFNPPLWSRIPTIFTLCDLIHLKVAVSRSVVQDAYYATVVRPACRTAFAVLTISEFSRSQVIEWTGLSAERVRKIDLGISEEFSVEGPSYQPGYPYLLYVGARFPHKNLGRLIEAFSRARLDSELRLLLSGDPDANLLERAHACGCADRLQFVGKVSDAVLAQIYRGAVALVLPSLFEGLGLPQLEAMACGTPTLVSDIEVLRESTGGHSLFVNPLDVDHMTAGLEKIVGDPSLRRDLSRQGTEWAKRFSWQTTAKQVLEVFADLP